MELLKQGLCYAVLFFTLSCAKNFNPVVSAPQDFEKEKILGQSYLEGSFLQEDGTMLNLSTLHDKPLLIFFVGEFCGDCIDETKELKQLVEEKGLPQNMYLISIMTSEGSGVIGDWFSDLEPTNAPAWILGSDQFLHLYHRYFETLSTPSVMSFDPKTQVLKRWQKNATSEKTPLSEILKEVKPWD